MQLNISKEYFYELLGIVGIKAHIEKISNLEINGSSAVGEIEVNLSYSDSLGMECFKVLTFPFELELDELKIIDVILSNIKITLVENQGVNILYSLVINYLKEDNKVIEVEKISDNNEVKLDDESSSVELNLVDESSGAEFDLSSEESDIEKIKEDISKEYEEKLINSLNNREEKVIVTKTHNTVNDFLSFFDERYSQKYSLKCLYVEKEEDLNKISKEYKIPMDKLLLGYDRKSHKVMFKIDK